MSLLRRDVRLETRARIVERGEVRQRREALRRHHHRSALLRQGEAAQIDPRRDAGKCRDLGHHRLGFAVDVANPHEHLEGIAEVRFASLGIQIAPAAQYHAGSPVHQSRVHRGPDRDRLLGVGVIERVNADIVQEERNAARTTAQQEGVEVGRGAGGEWALGCICAVCGSHMADADLGRLECPARVNARVAEECLGVDREHHRSCRVGLANRLSQGRGPARQRFGRLKTRAERLVRQVPRKDGRLRPVAVHYPLHEGGLALQEISIRMRVTLLAPRDVQHLGEAVVGEEGHNQLHLVRPSRLDDVLQTLLGHIGVLTDLRLEHLP